MKRARTSNETLASRRQQAAEKRSLKSKRAAGFRNVDGSELPPGAILANREALAHNQATIPEIAYPRFYADRAFRCRDCGSDELWTASQQKWWYEVAKGRIDSVAVRCRACRRRERERTAAARAAQAAGVVARSRKQGA